MCRTLRIKTNAATIAERPRKIFKAKIDLKKVRFFIKVTKSFEILFDKITKKV